MSGVTHGADAERLSTLAAGLVGSASRTREIATTGSMQPTVLAESWGPDVEQLGRQWEAALEDGASAEEAQDAGRDAVRELFHDGTYETGNTGESYEDCYGRARDRISS